MRKGDLPTRDRHGEDQVLARLDTQRQRVLLSPEFSIEARYLLTVDVLDHDPQTMRLLRLEWVKRDHRRIIVRLRRPRTEVWSTWTFRAIEPV